MYLTCFMLISEIDYVNKIKCYFRITFKLKNYIHSFIKFKN